MKNNIKKGFTFAELMISLVIIAVITAILYPTISELAPNNNKQLFKSAYKTIELVVSDVTANDDNGAFPQTAIQVCEEFEKRLNVINTEADSSGARISCSNGVGFTTTNGMRWFFRTNASSKAQIVVDVNASNNDITQQTDGTLTISDKWTKGYFIEQGNTVLTDTFAITIDENGKIIEISSPGTSHLTDKN